MNLEKLIENDAIAIIPARSGSKGLPSKNTKALCGKPLFMYSVEAALEAGLSKIFISTDSPEILNFDLPVGVKAVFRVPQLCMDETPMAEVVLDFLENSYAGPATVVLLQPTSPLRTHLHIKEALEVYEAGNRTLTMSVCFADSKILKWGHVSGHTFYPVSKPEYCFANRQSLPNIYRPNGAVYIFDAQKFRSDREFPSGSIRVIQMSETESIDIDSLADFYRCEKLLAQGEAK